METKEIRKTKRPLDEQEKIIHRLRRIEGQVRGLQKMVEDERYCIDILVQISAVHAALKNVGFSLLERHTHHCVSEAIKVGDGEDAISELMDIIKQFSK